MTMNMRIDMRTSTARKSITLLQPRSLQRKCACGNTFDGTGKCERCTREKELLQRKTGYTSLVDAIPPIVDDALRAPGQSLDPASKNFMESHFNRDFSAVRIHTDDKAAASSRAVNARAYTVGNDVIFGAGQYVPDTSEGRWLLTHELTHVVQQASGMTNMQKESDSQNDDSLERAADAMADSAMLATEEDTEGTEELLATGPSKKKSKAGGKAKPKEKDKSKKPADPCTRTILSEGTCQELVDKSKYNCCDPQNGLSSPKRDKDIDKVDCPSHKFTPIFTCDNNCKTALSKGCDDNDNWMAIPGKQFTKAQCGDVWTICANGKSTTGYVRDKSVTGTRFEVSPGIQTALGVTVGSSFKGSAYRPGAAQSAIDADACCNAPSPPPTQAPAKPASLTGHQEEAAT